jgi:hypothetical protein
VAGVEGESYWSSLEAKHDDLARPGEEFHATAKNTRDASVALRLGYTFDRLLLYGKLGADWGRSEWASIAIDEPNVFQNSAERTVTGIRLVRASNMPSWTIGPPSSNTITSILVIH